MVARVQSLPAANSAAMKTGNSSPSAMVSKSLPAPAKEFPEVLNRAKQKAKAPASAAAKPKSAKASRRSDKPGETPVDAPAELAAEQAGGKPGQLVDAPEAVSAEDASVVAVVKGPKPLETKHEAPATIVVEQPIIAGPVDQPVMTEAAAEGEAQSAPSVQTTPSTIVKELHQDIPQDTPPAAAKPQSQNSPTTAVAKTTESPTLPPSAEPRTELGTPAKRPATQTAGTRESLPKELHTLPVQAEGNGISSEKPAPPPMVEPLVPVASGQALVPVGLPASSASPMALAATAAAPTPEPRFIDDNFPRIVTSVHTRLLPDGGRMQIRLDPPELGALEVLVQMRDGQMTASFQTSTDEATRLLSHSLTQLKSALEAQGVTVEKLHVQQAARNDQPRGDEQPQRAFDENSARQEQQRREMLQRMWRRLAGERDPLDLTA